MLYVCPLAAKLLHLPLRTFYKFLIRRGHVVASPIKNLTMPKPERRLPKFVTVAQAKTLLETPLREFERKRETSERPVAKSDFLRDAAILETIYSCGLRISEVCGLRVEDLNQADRILQVRGKGRKERQIPIGGAALRAILAYWVSLPHAPAANSPIFLADKDSAEPIRPPHVQQRLKRYRTEY